MKFPKKLLFPVFMALFMSLIMSFALTLVNMGISPQFPLIWFRSFLISFVVAVPTAIGVTPLVRNIVAKIEKGME